ncbi:MAG: formylglycine-generating enzyme family protein [Proteobacteria bacterium]|nr:formylglycine-generating enzyme family protein [Pseudomonadota bacterium]
MSERARCVALATFFILASGGGCSAWIDDFSMGDGSVDSTDSSSEDQSTDSGMDTDSDVDTDSDTDADSDTDIDLDSDADNDIDTDGDTDGDTDSDTDTGSDSDPIDCGRPITPQSGDEIEFCSFGGGLFFMGCDSSLEPKETCLEDELPAHEVQISPFLLQRFEVTGEEYAAFVSHQDAWSPGGESAVIKCNSSYLKDWNEGKPPAGTERRPVLGVCWYAAQAYCKWLGSGFDLPTEAQWEFAARGGYDGHNGRDYRIFPFGNETSCSLANYQGCEGRSIDKGSAKGVSPGGIYDMSGNAWEWVRDWYRDDYYCDPQGTGYYDAPDCYLEYEWIDPQGISEGSVKVIRGGSWYHSPDMMRSARRHGLDPSTSSNLSGFRCAR